MQAQAAAFKAPVRIPVVYGANAALLDGFVFVAADADYELVCVSEVHDTAGTHGSAVTLDVVKCASGTTVASGTSLLTSTFDLKSTADIPVTKTVSNGGIAQAQSSRQILQGESVAFNFAGTLDALAGVSVTVTLNPVSRPAW
jgi:hypothetical protein